MEIDRQDQRLKQTLIDALWFWEPRRVLYNVILLSVVVAWFVLTWPHFRPAMNWFAFLRFCLLGVIANVCYCAAYLLDLPMSISEIGEAWARRRWILWSLGTVFALLLENYWIADEIYPFIR
jgi:hypothetical protein